MTFDCRATLVFQCHISHQKNGSELGTNPTRWTQNAVPWPSKSESPSEKLLQCVDVAVIESEKDSGMIDKDLIRVITLATHLYLMKEFGLPKKELIPLSNSYLVNPIDSLFPSNQCVSRMLR